MPERLTLHGSMQLDITAGSMSIIRAVVSQGGTPLSDSRGGVQSGQNQPIFFSVANTSNGSKIYPQTPNGSK